MPSGKRPGTAPGFPLEPEVRLVPLRSDAGHCLRGLLHKLGAAADRLLVLRAPPHRRPAQSHHRHHAGYVSEPQLGTGSSGHAQAMPAWWWPRAGKLRSNSVFNPGYPGLLTHNLTDYQTYGYRGFYCDAWRAIDLLLSRPEWTRSASPSPRQPGRGTDHRHAAWHPAIRAACPGAPTSAACARPLTSPPPIPMKSLTTISGSTRTAARRSWGARFLRRRQHGAAHQLPDAHEHRAGRPRLPTGNRLRRLRGGWRGGQGATSLPRRGARRRRCQTRSARPGVDAPPSSGRRLAPDCPRHTSRMGHKPRLEGDAMQTPTLPQHRSRRISMPSGMPWRPSWRTQRWRPKSSCCRCGHRPRRWCRRALHQYRPLPPVRLLRQPPPAAGAGPRGVECSWPATAVWCMCPWATWSTAGPSNAPC